jgi:hypothetical protein
VIQLNSTNFLSISWLCVLFLSSTLYVNDIVLSPRWEINPDKNGRMCCCEVIRLFYVIGRLKGAAVADITLTSRLLLLLCFWQHPSAQWRAKRGAVYPLYSAAPGPHSAWKESRAQGNNTTRCHPTIPPMPSSFLDKTARTSVHVKHKIYLYQSLYSISFHLIPAV